MLQGEMDAHLTGCQPTETPPEEVDADELSLVPNKRNGFSHKTLKTEFGPLPLSVPRDRRNTFDPIIVPKHSRSFGKMDEQIIAMYARGMSTCDIQAFIDNLYGVDISPDYVSKVTDRVLEDVQEWQNRPLESVYPVAFFDAIRVKIRSGAAVKNMAVLSGLACEQTVRVRFWACGSPRTRVQASGQPCSTGSRPEVLRTSSSPLRMA